MRTYRVNRPTADKGKSAGSNARVVCSTLLCAMPMRQEIVRLGCFSAQTSCTPATPLYAGVEPTHTRICSATSCDVFARVVSIKPWGETDLSFLLCPPPALTGHALLPATQSRMRKEFKRGIPSSFCPFRTFRTGEKYMVLFCYFSDRRKVHPFIVTFPME